MEITIANLRQTTEGIRCDRISVLGNPFHMRSEEERLDVVKAYKRYLSGVAIDQEDPSILASRMADKYLLQVSTTWKRPTSRQFVQELNRIQQLSNLEDVTLLCWCAPLACHCNIIRDYINWKNSQLKIND